MTRICVVTRGHGFGHAARDLRILQAVRALRPDIEIVLASAGSGTEYYRSRGVEVTDLGFDDADDTGADAGWRVMRFLHDTAPYDLVVADELMVAPAFCRHVLRTPCVLLTDWFFAELGRPEADAALLGDATEIVVPDFPQAHPTPVLTAAPVWFCGPVVAEFAGSRAESRAALGLAKEASVVVVALGGRPDRRAALEIQLQLLRTWRIHAGADDRLLILAEPPSVRGRAPYAPTVQWAGRSGRPEVYYRAADVVVADALGFTCCELVRNRVPTLAVLNPDPGRTVRPGLHDRMDLLESTGLLRLATPTDDPDVLWGLVRQLRTATGRRSLPSGAWGEPSRVAERLLGHLPAADRSRPVRARTAGPPRSPEQEVTP